MRLIGATNFMIRAPFIVEGVMIGLIGALIPLVETISSIQKESYICLSGSICCLTCFTLFRLDRFIRLMIGAALILGVGIGFSEAFFTIRKYMKV